MKKTFTAFAAALAIILSILSYPLVGRVSATGIRFEKIVNTSAPADLNEGASMDTGYGQVRYYYDGPSVAAEDVTITMTASGGCNLWDISKGTVDNPGTTKTTTASTNTLAYYQYVHAVNDSIAQGTHTCTITMTTTSPNAAFNFTGTVTYSIADDEPVAVTAAPAPTPAPKTTAKPAPTPTPASAPVAPEAPKPASVSLNGVASDVTKPVTIEYAKPVVISGKTLPNAIVNLTIHSEPRTATVTADKDGNWTYTVTDLEPGDHYVEASVTDPTTKLTSPVSKVLSFSVAQPTKATPRVATATPVAAKKSPTVMYIAGALVLLACSLAGGFVVYKKKLRSRGLSL